MGCRYSHKQAKQQAYFHFLGMFKGMTISLCSMKYEFKQEAVRNYRADLECYNTTINLE